MTSRQPPAGASFPSDIRRNLFRSQPPRRPPASTSSSALATAGGAPSATLLESPDAGGADDIVVRDPSGKYTPTFPALPAPEAGEPEGEGECDEAGKLDEGELYFPSIQCDVKDLAVLTVHTAKLQDMLENRGHQQSERGR